MKKFILLLMVVAAAMNVAAQTRYTFLTLETTEGTKVSIPTESLTLTINGSTLTAGSKTFTLSNLAKFFFTTTDETTATGISQMGDGQLTIDQTTEVYDLNGRRIVRGISSNGILPHGAYLVKTKEKTYKLVVK